MGTLGNPADPRTLKLYWNIMDEQEYPLAKYALAGIKENEQHLPPEIEKMLMANPQLMQLAGAAAQSLESGTGGAGGVRPNSVQKVMGQHMQRT